MGKSAIGPPRIFALVFQFPPYGSSYLGSHVLAFSSIASGAARVLRFLSHFPFLIHRSCQQSPRFSDCLNPFPRPEHVRSSLLFRFVSHSLFFRGAPLPLWRSSFFPLSFFRTYFSRQSQRDSALLRDVPYLISCFFVLLFSRMPPFCSTTVTV